MFITWQTLMNGIFAQRSITESPIKTWIRLLLFVHPYKKKLKLVRIFLIAYRAFNSKILDVSYSIEFRQWFRL